MLPNFAVRVIYMPEDSDKGKSAQGCVTEDATGGYAIQAGRS